MSLISNQARLARQLFAVVMLCQHAGLRLYPQTRAILERKGARRSAGASVALLVVSGFLLLAGVLKGQAEDNGLTVPEAWRGKWEVTVAYRDRETGALVATDVTTAAICPGEPIVPPVLNTFLHSSGQANESNIGLSCHAKHSPRPGCNLFVEVSFNSHRDGDTWTGAGSWTARVVGNCEHLNFGEDFVVSGRRVRQDAACDGEGSSLVHRFFAHGALVPVLGGRN